MRPLLVAALLAMPFAALSDGAGIQIDHVWSRAAMAGHEGVVYLTITDTGPQDTLIAITTPVAARAELHQSFDDHGVMKMRPVLTLPIEPGKPVTLAPGGYHVMLMGLKQALNQGDSFPVTLSFATAGQVSVTATVAKAGASSMPQRMDMPGMVMPGGEQQR